MNRPKYTTHKSYHKMITPEKNPSLFRIEPLPCGDYHTYVYHSIGLDEDIQSASYRYWREQYKLAKPEELTDGKIDNTKYVEWANSEESSTPELLRGEKQSIASLLFIPIGAAPKVTSDEFWYTLTSEQYQRIRSFTKPTSQNNSDGQATSAVSTINSPVSEKE